MHALILGAAGMIGRRLVDVLVAEGRVGGQPLTGLTLLDVVTPTAPEGVPGPVRAEAADLTAPGAAEAAIRDRPEVIFHLAAVVSGEAEANFDLGYRVNLDATRSLFEAIRAAHEAEGYTPKVVFTSSLAVFGPPFPAVIPDDHILRPATSYGTQKAMGEMLLADYARRGIFGGIGLRLPTICVRPGKPNKAASGFFSGIIREPLAGQEAILPVPDTVRHWFASPAAAVGFLTHAAELDLARLGTRRSLTMPGVSATVAEEIEALRRAAGDKAVALIRRQPDEAVQRIVETWPESFDTAAATDLGFRADASFDAIVAQHIAAFHGG
ncbi:D-erythronate dehydrogenase [Methylobacterium aerolatum]|uniref:Nucleoside-diphosphate-sugar epimerase n=1 Tax=Methylobacterium aerolatum TaxID=418708 RepID=A0ABU0I599_9HYPH|nr:D-erythronate dehydrogenase [Methylobacterium aerolatum]MDQ0449798.1 nucleoside-diphosphate-sugar epimerase [Methylobacterium aerolatum]GJD36569.1 D-erythronate dehydrogenase [Methylobacterium aerolatum]